MLLKGFQMLYSSIKAYWYHCVPFSWPTIHRSGGNVNLNPLAGILHLFIKLWNVLEIWISTSHVQNQLHFIGCMLVGVAMRTMGTIFQRLGCTVIPFSPPVDILPVQMVTNGCRCDSVLVCIFDCSLPKAHGLCYCIHGEQSDTCLSVLSQQLNLNTGHSYSLFIFPLKNRFIYFPVL